MILCEQVSDGIGMELDSAVQTGAAMMYAQSAEDEAALTACAAEVRVLLQGAWGNIMKIGGVLKQAKDKCAYGTWGKWVERECGFSAKTASRYMAVYDRFRDNDKVLALPGSLSYALLGVPDEDEVNALAEEAAQEGWSERQLKAEIARRKQAEQRAEDAARELESAVNAAQEIEDDFEREKTALATQLREAQQRAEALEQNLTDARERMEQLRTERDDARRAKDEPKTVEKCVEVYPVDYDAAKAENETLKRERDAQAEEMDRLRRELAAARREAGAARAEGTQSTPKPAAAEKRSGPVQAITAAQVGEMVSAFLDRMEDVARQQFDFMPAAMAGEYLDQIARVEQFCANLRAVISGE